MRGVLFAVTTGIAATAIMWVVTTVIASLASPWQWLLVVFTGLGSFGGSWILSRRTKQKSGSENGSQITIGKDIRAKKDVHIEDIAIQNTRGTVADNIEIGTGINSGGGTHIRQIRLGGESTEND
jgi:membrane protein implicated in regulation of membrane protease activity